MICGMVSDPSAAASASAPHQFDLVIIGTGSANSIIGPAFDNWSIALIEESVFGGTCLNRGCIPTKMLVYAADVAETVRHAARLGVDAHVDAVRWRDIRDRVFNRIDPIAAGGEDYRTNRCPNVTVLRGRGRFVGPRQVAVGNTIVEGRHVVVAVGGRPMIPDIAGLADVAFHTSDDIMRIDDVPKHLIVLGGGFIANELAHVFGAFGARVTMINRSDRLLRAEDDDVSAAFTEQIRARAGFDLRFGVTVSAVRSTRAGLGGNTITVELSDGTEVSGDALLVATGRIPNTDTLDVAAGGLATNSDAQVVVDEFQATNVPGVWALGDVSSPYLLKHVANHEARVVQHNLLHPHTPLATDHRFVPHAVFTNPQIASVGITEKAARAAGFDVMTKSQAFGDTAYGWALEDTTSFCKLVADRSTRQLLGAHFIGPHSAILIQQLIQGMAFGQTVDEIARGQYYIHPAMPEVVENALLGLE